MPPVRTPALILHAFPYGDTSRILRLLTPQYGIRSVLAKGARSARSRFGGLLEPFTEGEALFNLRQGRDLYILSGFTLLRSRQAIGRDFMAFAGASLIAEILIRFGTDEADPALYETVVDCFDRLATGRMDPAGASLASLWKLVGLFGFAPEMRTCTGCGRELADDEYSRFDPEAGGVACFACRPAGRRISPEVRSGVAEMVSSGLAGKSPTELRTHGDLLHAFLAAHLLHGQPLRSLPLYLDQLR